MTRTATREHQKNEQAAQELLAGRPMPAAPAAERSVIGAILLDPGDAMIACSDLTEAHFHQDRHKIIWRAVRHLESQGRAIDLVTLTEHLSATRQLEQIGGTDYLIALGDEIPTAVYAEHHVRILEERHTARQLVQQAAGVIRLVHDNQLDDAISLISTPVELQSGKQFTIHNADAMRALLRPQEQNARMSCGMNSLDQQIGYLEAGRLYVLAARPAMGKTMLALQIALNVAQHYQKGVLFASLEMPAQELQLRLTCQMLGVRQDDVNERNPETMRIIEQHLPNFEQIPLYYEDNQDMSLRDLEVAARRRSQEPGGLGMIIVDYLQLMEVAGMENRNEEISKLTRALKRMARRLEIPIIVLSQLSRKVESRPDKRPMLSDLRESGSVEQDADVVMFIYRDEYYNPDTPDRGIAELIVAKRRSGPTGIVRLGFRGASARFTELQ